MSHAQGETSMGGDLRSFQPTLWTVVMRAKDPTSPDGKEALHYLIQEYWKPIYCFVRRSSHGIEESKDITQGFFAALLEKDFFQRVEEGRGKFRSFLLVALRHYLKELSERGHAQKRGGGRSPFSLDFVQAETDVGLDPAGEDTPEQVFKRQWAGLVIRRALQSLRQESDDAGRAAEFDALNVFFSLDSQEVPSYLEVASRIGGSEADVKSKLHRMRKRYRELILAQIRGYADSEESAREELRDLFTAFT
jgi:RNA polymerase sigma-70 factor (ECF subfamily)